ncbi:contact-dependent growth inhibition system immunity protein [Comamonas odontotermitis]|uniref:contact-dependent growth inhibition system immunity protein n=1 Tax=Comamonas odontotermitis TaxID=379895 RepID=UPI001CC41421|nr:contact-dependent growth inhibition system immunity protein [Comamonas odontotermitis]UBB16070.1 CdiI family contact-dependent growth inhibition immunity protein [Comamonas odontotermitis]
MNKSTAWANVSFNDVFFEITTISRGMLGYGDPEVEPQYLPLDISDKILGESLRLALSKSKRVSLEEFQKLWNSGILEETEKMREKYTMNKYGYKTKKALYKNMNLCDVSVYGDFIEIQPTQQTSLDGYTVTKDMDLTPLKISHTVSDEELGAALRHAFTLCTSAIR